MNALRAASIFDGLRPSKRRSIRTARTPTLRRASPPVVEHRQPARSAARRLELPFNSRSMLSTYRAGLPRCSARNASRAGAAGEIGAARRMRRRDSVRIGNAVAVDVVDSVRNRGAFSSSARTREPSRGRRLAGCHPIGMVLLRCEFIPMSRSSKTNTDRLQPLGQIEGASAANSKASFGTARE